MAFDSDREAVRRILETVPLTNGRAHRIVRIQDTLSLEKVEVSDSYADELKQRPDLEPLGPARELAFDPQGNLPPLCS
jgi:hypothetical protein